MIWSGLVVGGADAPDCAVFSAVARHPAMRTPVAEMDAGAPADHCRGGKVSPADVYGAVGGQEIGIDGCRQDPCRPCGRIVAEAEVEDPPHPRDVAADGGLHEPRKQRHSADMEHARLRVIPKSDESSSSNFGIIAGDKRHRADAETGKRHHIREAAASKFGRVGGPQGER